MAGWSRVLGLIAAAAAALAFAPAGAGAAGDGGGGLKLKEIGGGFDQPIYATSAPGKRNRKLVFVVERGGTIRIVKKNRNSSRVFADISGRVATDGEGGLLSMAFDPRYEKNRRFYVYYTNAAQEIVVEQLRRKRNKRLKASPRGRQVIAIPHADALNHYGGTVAFGPDDLMYLATGDGGGACDIAENAQNRQNLLGKLVRIKPKPKGGYRIPAGNPYSGPDGRPEIAATGLRNPFRFSFDQKTRSIAIGDVGQGQWEEVDFEPVAGLPGANFGWDIFEGSSRFDPTTIGPCAEDNQTPEPAGEDLRDPVHEYPHDGSGHTGCSITGGSVLHDRRLPRFEGRYIYADFCTGDIRSLVPDGSGPVDDRTTGASIDAPSSFVADARGRAIATSLGGQVYRLKPNGTSARERSPDGRGDRLERVGDGRGGFRISRIASFSDPVYVHGPAGAKGLIFVVEQGGKIKLIKDGKKLGGTFLNISKRVQSGGERGLLSVAFSPFYANNRRFYVFYTDGRGDLIVEEYRTSRKNPRDAVEKSARRVIRIPHRDASNHNGGQLQFGPDNKLYISTGDGGGGGDPAENAQNKGVLLGKILRIDPRKSKGNPYTVPNDNPFKGKPGRKEIFSLGLRNPYRFSFDRARKKIAIGDVGQERREEIDYERIGKAKGANFGWDAFEGSLRFGPDGSPPPANHEKPIHEYSHSGGRCSITGGYVVRDKRLKSLFGRYLYADFCGGDIRSLIPKTKGAKSDRSTKLGKMPGISSFGEDSRGRIYLANLFEGGVYRIKPK